MEKFKGKIQKRVILLSLTAIFTAAVYFILLSGLVIDMPTVPEFIKGFNMGAFSGVELVLVFFTVKYFISMKNETAMKKLYIEENDERTKMIFQKTGAVGMTLFIILCAIAAIVAGFFNQTVFYTLLGTTILGSLIRGACKVYYHKTL